MKILYVMEKMSCRGGMERIITDKINYLAAHTAHEVTLMTVWHDSVPPAYPFHPGVKHVRLNVPLPPVPGGYMLTLPWALRRFNNQVKRLNPDVTIVFRAVGSFLTALTSWKGRIIYESHQPRSTMNHPWIYRFMERRADAIVCLTKGDALEFLKAKRIEVIHNFTEITPPHPAPLTAKRCIAVGRLCKEKDFMRLLDIWALVMKQHPDWHLDIFGEGEERPILERRIRELNLGSSVELKGLAKNIVEEYLDSSMLIATSKTEGFSIVIAEAMMCGLPIVSLDCPYGPREVMAEADEAIDGCDCKTGFLVPCRNASSNKLMADCISALISSPALRKEKGQAALRRATLFRPAPIMAQWLRIFKSILT